MFCAVTCLNKREIRCPKINTMKYPVTIFNMAPHWVVSSAIKGAPVK